MSKLPHRLGEKWPLFYDKIKQNTSGEDDQILLDEFEKICEEFNINISESKGLFFDAFPGRIEEDRKYIEMTHLNELVQANKINNMFDKVDLSEDNEEEMGDFSGYTGIVKRGYVKLEDYSYKEFMKLIQQDNRLPIILRSIRDIDQDNNGYVTTTELEDIIKVHYKQLENKNLKKMFRPFASIQNRILIDYKKFKKDLVDRLHLDEKSTMEEMRKNSPRLMQNKKKQKTKLNSLTVGNLAKLGTVRGNEFR
jgi:hypothetical protein